MVKEDIDVCKTCNHFNRCLRLSQVGLPKRYKPVNIGQLTLQKFSIDMTYTLPAVMTQGSMLALIVRTISFLVLTDIKYHLQLYLQDFGNSLIHSYLVYFCN